MVVGWTTRDGQVKTGTLIDYIPGLDEGCAVIAETKLLNDEDRPLFLKPIRELKAIG